MIKITSDKRFFVVPQEVVNLLNLITPQPIVSQKSNFFMLDNIKISRSFKIDPIQEVYEGILIFKNFKKPIWIVDSPDLTELTLDPSKAFIKKEYLEDISATELASLSVLFTELLKLVKKGAITIKRKTIFRVRSSSREEGELVSIGGINVECCRTIYFNDILSGWLDELQDDITIEGVTITMFKPR